ncbi:terminase gpA endonuclease subunit [Desulfogranum japonicum]|uniref:terminase gpA endonuclease subunit n=1 Tax=Desulfogranum japonicum TaxID=231447 RepID=UPI000416659E|nr:terminase gpA endonuclease subunit [Desulfogranum japonicum]
MVEALLEFHGDAYFPKSETTIGQVLEKVPEQVLPLEGYISSTEEESALLDMALAVIRGDNQVATLVAGVDNQDDGFVYYINALGWGLKQTCWYISSGVAVTFQALVKILWEDE